MKVKSETGCPTMNKISTKLRDKMNNCWEKGHKIKVR